MTPPPDPAAGGGEARVEDGIEWYEVPGRPGSEDCQCARCGSSCGWQNCWNCGGTGEIEDTSDWTLGGLIEEYDRCDHCEGYGGWHYCLSGRAWCEANPLPAREHITSTARGRDDQDD